MSKNFAHAKSLDFHSYSLLLHHPISNCYNIKCYNAVEIVNTILKYHHHQLHKMTKKKSENAIVISMGSDSPYPKRQYNIVRKSYDHFMHLCKYFMTIIYILDQNPLSIVYHLFQKDVLLELCFRQIQKYLYVRKIQH